jgi:hypothetical protein
VTHEIPEHWSTNNDDSAIFDMSSDSNIVISNIGPHANNDDSTVCDTSSDS